MRSGTVSALCASTLFTEATLKKKTQDQINSSLPKEGALMPHGLRH